MNLFLTLFVVFASGFCLPQTPGPLPVPPVNPYPVAPFNTAQSQTCQQNAINSYSQQIQSIQETYQTQYNANYQWARSGVWNPNTYYPQNSVFQEQLASYNNQLMQAQVQLQNAINACD